MLFDWFTVIAQIVNFLILVYLLKRFLYKPILHAIDEREKRISDRIQESKALEVKAQEERERYEHTNKELAQNKADLLSEARENAEEERRQLLESARKEYAKLRVDLDVALKNEQSNLRNSLQQRIQQEVFEIARKVLTDLADTNLEAQISKLFLQKLAHLNKDEQAQLKAAFKPGSQTVTVRSAFEMSAAQKPAFEQVVKELLGTTTVVQFQISAGEIGGIELAAGGYKIVWTITEYLDTLEKRITGMTEEATAAELESKI